jgi:hypothetical protein
VLPPPQGGEGVEGCAEWGDGAGRGGQQRRVWVRAAGEPEWTGVNTGGGCCNPAQVAGSRVAARARQRVLGFDSLPAPSFALRRFPLCSPAACRPSAERESVCVCVWNNLVQTG